MSEESKIQEAIFAGRKIEAIKLMREQSGMGLKESKEAVEKLEGELRVSSPERFTKPAGKGCTPVVLAGVSLIGGIVYWLLAA